MNRSMKQRTSIVLAGLAALSLAACSSSTSGPGGSSSGSSGGLKVALVQSNEQAAFFVQMNEGAKAEAKAEGVDLTIFNANNDPTAQARAIQTYIQQGYKAIMFDALDDKAILPSIAAGHKAGVKMISLDTDLSSDPDLDAQIGTDNGGAAVQGGKYLCTYAKKNKVALKIGIVGALASQVQNLRQKQFVSTVTACGASILQVVNGQNVQEQAQTAAENLFTAQPSMTVLYGTGEPAIIGAVAAARSHSGKVKIFGFDLSQSAIGGIDSGSVLGIIQQDPYGEGKAGLAAAVSLLKTGKVAQRITNLPTTIVTKDNVEKYRKAFG